MLYGRCEFGKDDYSFNIVNLPYDETYIDETVEDELIIEETKGKKSKLKKSSRSAGIKDDDSQPTLF